MSVSGVGDIRVSSLPHSLVFMDSNFAGNFFFERGLLTQFLFCVILNFMHLLSNFYFSIKVDLSLYILHVIYMIN